MQAAVFNNTDNPLNTEDYASLRAAIEVYARWLDAQEIINSSTEEKTNDKRMKVLELLGLEKSNKKEIKYSELRHLYLCKTDFNKNPSQEVKVKAVAEITQELGYKSEPGCLSALMRSSIKGCGMQELKLPSVCSIDILFGKSK